ncbi:MAG: hypothetical protein QOH93_1105 [Chloroflexia bacterium]|jgi:hypothetical protein|nr:hypothetical protein [Chloroflexia bacterium]
MDDSRMVGKPTLMAIYPQRYEAAAILDSLRRVGYPLNDVSVYYRLKGTDHVVDATTGRVAAGQSVNQDEVTQEGLNGAETVVLLHPGTEVVETVTGALLQVGEPNILYEGETDVAGSLGGYTRIDDTYNTEISSS